VQQYDKNKIGKFIAKGGDFSVYKYGENEVIKFSSLAKIFGKKMQEKLQNDYIICKKYFKDYVVETKIIHDTKSHTHTEIQPFIKGTELQASDCSEAIVFEQLKDIQNHLHTMARDKQAPIDLLGLKGIHRNVLQNILIDTNKRLHIIDATLLESPSIFFIKIITKPFLIFAHFLQKRRLKYFLKQHANQ
jgi:hypothetical protein